MPRFFFAVCLTLLAILFSSSARLYAATPNFLWLEGEKPASADFQWEALKDKPGMLSNDLWLNAKEKDWRKEGFSLTYNLTVPKDGNYNLWLRVGYEFVRPNVAWRIGEGKWTTVGFEDPSKKANRAPAFDVVRPTTNLKELGLWTEVAWWNVGVADLKAGTTTLTLRFTQAQSKAVMLALDAICLIDGPWNPEGRLQPGQDYKDDEDQKAAAQIYQLPTPASVGERSSVRLTGLWQVARYDDPDMDVNTYDFVKSLPTPEQYQLHWLGINVPGSLWHHKETAFAHRAIYRTQVNIPADQKGRSFYLHFSGTNWLASVFVNGQLAGTHRGVLVPWDLDISPYITAGKANEIAVAIKGPYYAIDSVSSGQKIESYRNRPLSKPDWIRWVAPIYPSSKGEGNATHYGLVNAVTLTSAGSAYTQDVFVKTSVAKKRLDAEVTLCNSSNTQRKFQLTSQAVNNKTNQVEKSFAPVDVVLAANGSSTVTVGGDWPEAKLWWPLPDPDLYRLRTTVSENGSLIDAQETLFGFREVTIDGISVRLNGIRRNFWNWVHSGDRAPTPDAWAENFRFQHDRFQRLCADLSLARMLPAREDQLDFYDRHGIPGRLSTCIDGMFVSYHLGGGKPDPAHPKQSLWAPNQPLWDNFTEHLQQVAHAYRNHPSILLYQAENELVYINGQNLYVNWIDQIQAEMAKAIDAGRKNDPTRPWSVGGGGDLAGRLEINSPHYPESSMDLYPENAYTVAKQDNHSARWLWKHDKPWIVGESWLQGAPATVIGDDAYRSKADSDRGQAAGFRMLYGGWRWAEVAGFFPWSTYSQTVDGQKIFADLYIIPRKQTTRLYAATANKLLFKLCNDTFSSAPLTFQWSYTIDGKQIAGETKTLTIEPGFGKEVELTINAPPTDHRLEGTLTLISSQPGTDTYKDVRSVPVLPQIGKLSLPASPLLLDRSGKLADFLTAHGVTFTKLDKLADIAGKSGFLLIGPETLTAEESFGQTILAFALQGNRVLAFEQTNPISGGNLPVPMIPTARTGGYAHPQALGTPLFADLGKEDLIDWAGDHPTFQAAYLKPSRGIRSLAQAGESLQLTCLTEVPCGKGIITLCQLRVGSKLGLDPAADVLARNLLQRYAAYQPADAVAAVFAPNNPHLAEAVENTGILQEKVPTLANGLNPTKYRCLVIDATPENLRALVNLEPQTVAFQKAGSWIMLCGLTPKGLDSFNQFMHTNHILRPFRMEHVTMQSPEFPLAAGLGNRDLSLFSAESIPNSSHWVSSDTFSYILDAGEDVAPFAQMPGGPADPYEYKPTFSDGDPFNYVNGLLASDNWRYIRQLGIEPRPIIFKLRRPETLSALRIWNNTFYYTIKDLDIVIDGDEAHPIKAVLPENADPTTIAFDSPRLVNESVTLIVRSYRPSPTNAKVKLVGIDNLQFLRARKPADITIDSVGGLVAWSMPNTTPSSLPGGILLNQLKFMDREANPDNPVKKSTILSTLLQNMGVGFRTSTAAIPGLNVKFQRVVLTKWCNEYLTEAQGGKVGWFGNKNQDLRELQKGEQYLSNILFHVEDYVTAPVPNCIMLGSRSLRKDLPQEVKGIEVNQKADVLFFLHAAALSASNMLPKDARLKAQASPTNAPPMARYILNYSDGKSVTIPVLLEQHVTHWLLEKPAPLPGATLAWTAPIKGLKENAGLYAMQVVNPRPDVTILSIDIAQPPLDRKGNPADRGAFATLAITLGKVNQ